LDLREWRAAARRHHQFPRRVSDDAAQCANVERLAVERSAIEVLRATATNAQRPPIGSRGANSILQRGERGIRHRDGLQAAAILSRYRLRGSSASTIVVSASAAVSHSRISGCARRAARYAPAAPVGLTPYVWKRNATGP